MDRRKKKVELFEQMRREYEHGVGTIKGVARKFGVHRRMVREAIGNAVPPPRKIPERDKPKLGTVVPWIEQMLEADRKAPRKQRHTAHRIWCRLQAEHPEAAVAESTVRRYVRLRKLELGLGQAEVFVPQSYQWGQEGQVDGTKRGPRSMAKSRKRTCFACVAWPAAGPFTGRIRMPANRRFWKRMSWRSPILAGCLRCSDMTISRVP